MLTYFSLKAVIGDADFNNNKQITFQEIYNLVADRVKGGPIIGTFMILCNSFEFEYLHGYNLF